MFKQGNREVKVLFVAFLISIIVIIAFRQSTELRDIQGLWKGQIRGRAVDLSIKDSVLDITYPDVEGVNTLRYEISSAEQLKDMLRLELMPISKPHPQIRAVGEHDPIEMYFQKKGALLNVIEGPDRVGSFTSRDSARK